MTRNDPELGPEKFCRCCGEWWPNEPLFFTPRYASCNACRAERTSGRPIRNVKATALFQRKPVDPTRAAMVRERQRVASWRYYWRHRAPVLERRRQRYAAQLDRPVRPGFGRPRVAA